jgi:mRNA guanylyltransferase
LGEIGNKIVGPYRQHAHKHKMNKADPFELIAKSFYPKENIGSLLRQVDMDRHIFKGSNGKRHHKTDGIIFTPTGPYSCFVTTNLLKWKFLSKQTMDFIVERNQDGQTWNFYCSNRSRNILTKRNAELMPEDEQRLIEDMSEVQAQKKDAQIIGEFSFSSSKGLWKYHMLRPDKPISNPVTTIIETMEAIAENISVEDIVNVCCPKNHLR